MRITVERRARAGFWASTPSTARMRVVLPEPEEPIIRMLPTRSLASFLASPTEISRMASFWPITRRSSRAAICGGDGVLAATGSILVRLRGRRARDPGLSCPSHEVRRRSGPPRDRTRGASRARARPGRGPRARALRRHLRLRRPHPPRPEPLRGLSPGDRPRVRGPGGGGGAGRAPRPGGRAGGGGSRDRLRRLLPVLRGPTERVPPPPGARGAPRRRLQRASLRSRRERPRRPRLHLGQRLRPPSSPSRWRPT